MIQDTRSRYLDKIMLRLPDGMRDQIKQVSAQNKRSMNSEIVFQLERIYGASENSDGAGSLATQSPVTENHATSNKAA